MKKEEKVKAKRPSGVLFIYYGSNKHLRKILNLRPIKKAVSSQKESPK